MFQQIDDQPILESLALTTKLEKSLRKMISGQKSTVTHTIQRQKYHEHGTIDALERQIQRLQQKNKELFSDNQQVCRDLLRLRDENRQLKKQVVEHKKYITHLQGFNEQLKKELIFWMRKPTKSQNICDKNEDNLGSLMTEVMKLRKQNEQRQSQLRELGQTLQIKQIKTPPPLAHRLAINMNSIPIVVKQKKHKRTNTVYTKANQCTSCNYNQFSNKSKNLDSYRDKSYSHKRHKSSKLCECHRNYVQTSQFKC